MMMLRKYGITSIGTHFIFQIYDKHFFPRNIHFILGC